MNNVIKKIILITGIALFLLGCIGIFQRVVLGHEAANYGSYIPWGLWVAAYTFFMGISAGSFIFSSLIYIFKIEKFKKIGKLVLLNALVSLIAALIAIWIDLGRPERFLNLYFSTNFGSIMGIMAWLYLIYFFILVIKLWFAMRADLIANRDEKGLKGVICRLISFGRKEMPDSLIEKDNKKLKVISIIGVLISISFSAGVGALFGVVGARSYWNSGLLPILFLAGGLLSSVAIITVLTSVYGPNQNTEEHKNLISLLGKIILGLLIFDIIIEFAEIFIGLWNAVPSSSLGIKLVLFGEYWWVFWGLHVGLGIIVPLILLIFKGKTKAAVGIAGLLIAVTFITVRLNIIIPGLAIEEIKGLVAAFSGPGLTLHYAPSLMEWLVFAWIVSLAVLLFQVGKNLLPITQKEEVK